MQWDLAGDGEPPYRRTWPVVSGTFPEEDRATSEHVEATVAVEVGEQEVDGVAGVENVGGQERPVAVADGDNVLSAEAGEEVERAVAVDVERDDLAVHP